MRIQATFARRGDRVLIDFGRVLQHVDMDYETAYDWARALIKLGEDAQRVGAGHAAMSRREVDRFEEAILGTPSVRGS